MKDINTKIIVDASVVASWLLEDEQSDYALSVKEKIIEGFTMIQPSIWLFEITNILRNAQRRKRVSFAQSKDYLEAISALPIEISNYFNLHNSKDLFELADKHNLTTYDAAYIQLAKSYQVALATMDRELKQAAKREKVKIF